MLKVKSKVGEHSNLIDLNSKRDRERMGEFGPPPCVKIPFGMCDVFSRRAERGRGKGAEGTLGLFGSTTVVKQFRSE